MGNIRYFNTELCCFILFEINAHFNFTDQNQYPVRKPPSGWKIQNKLSKKGLTLHSERDINIDESVCFLLDPRMTNNRKMRVRRENVKEADSESEAKSRTIDPCIIEVSMIVLIFYLEARWN